ncbi:hypothetical protein LguiA_031740 [Lonicera macranthoides]
MSEHLSNQEEFPNFESQKSTLINLDNPVKNTRSKSKVNVIMPFTPNESPTSNTRSKSTWAVVKSPLVYLHDSPSKQSTIKKLHAKRRIITTDGQCSIKPIPVPFTNSLDDGVKVEPTDEPDVQGGNNVVKSSQKACNQVNVEEIVDNPDWDHFNSDNEESDFDEVLEAQIEKSNPNSLLYWKACSETNKFLYLCVAFRSSLDGWIKGCRPIVGLNGCFLKGKYRGVCLCAIGMDGNNGMFLLAIFICKNEDGESYNKFLELIAPELKKHPLPLTIMSDRASDYNRTIDELDKAANGGPPEPLLRLGAPFGFDLDLLGHKDASLIYPSLMMSKATQVLINKVDQNDHLDLEEGNRCLILCSGKAARYCLCMTLDKSFKLRAVCAAEDTLSVYLEYVYGGSIHKLLQEYGSFREPVMQNYTRQILSGLAYLHGRNTVHRDIKGANILVDPNGEIKLADFARLFGTKFELEEDGKIVPFHTKQHPRELEKS